MKADVISADQLEQCSTVVADTVTYQWEMRSAVVFDGPFVSCQQILMWLCYICCSYTNQFLFDVPCGWAVSGISRTGVANLLHARNSKRYMFPGEFSKNFTNLYCYLLR